MNMTTPSHLNSVFDIDVWIDRSYADDQVLEIVAYPMAIRDSLDNGERIGSIDTNHMVGSFRLPVDSLARDELDRKALMGHVGGTIIGINSDCWSPEDVASLFGPTLGPCVMKVLVDAWRNEFKGRDVNGRLYRVPGSSGRRGTQRTSALADTMAGRKTSRGRNDLDSRKRSGASYRNVGQPRRLLDEHPHQVTSACHPFVSMVRGLLGHTHGVHQGNPLSQVRPTAVSPFSGGACVDRGQSKRTTCQVGAAATTS